MPGIDKTNIGIVYTDQYSKYENLNTIGDSSIFFVKNHGIYVGQHMVANYYTNDENAVSGVIMNNEEAILPDENGIVNLGTIVTDPSIDDKFLDISTDIQTLDTILSIVGNNLNKKITDVSIELTNYYTKTEIDNNGYLTEETDPTVPAWAKQSTKPTYTANEVGALPSDTEIPDSLSDLSDDSTHRVVTDASINNWNSKQDSISDLDNIRTGAALGATSLQNHQNIKTVNQQTITGTGNVSVGTITGITMNGQSKGTIGIVDLGTVLISEVDPVYTASAAAGISSTDITNWNNKLTKTQADEYYVTYDYIGSLNDLTSAELNTIFS